MKRYPHLQIEDISKSTIPLDNCEFKAINTPGHSKDHMSYALESETSKVLFAGDIVLSTPSVSFCDLTEYMQNLETL